jgi:hypothetical protein
VNLSGLTALHLLACWHPLDVAHSSSSSSATPLAGSSKKAATGEKGMSAADVAGVAEQLAAATLLLDQQPVAGGPDVNVQCGHLQDTPLAFAAITGAYDMAAWLISRGADVNLPRRTDTARPIDLAVAGGKTDLACLLLEHGAEVSMLVNSRGMILMQCSRLTDCVVCMSLTLCSVGASAVGPGCVNCVPAAVPYLYHSAVSRMNGRVCASEEQWQRQGQDQQARSSGHKRSSPVGE